MNISYYAIPGIPHSTKPNVEKLLALVATHFQITRSQLVGRQRKRLYTEARGTCYHIMRYKFHMRITEISRIFVKDHATIIYALRTLDNLITTEDWEQRHIVPVQQQL